MIYHSEMLNKETAIKQLGNLFLRGGEAGIADQYAKSWATANSLRLKHDQAQRSDLIRIANNQYLAKVSAAGAASGAIAAAPYFGTFSTVSSTAADLFYFGKASVTHILLLAALHDLELTEPQLRRLTVLSSLIGENEPINALGEARPFIESMNQKLAERVAIKVGAKLLPARMGAALPLMVGAATAATINARIAKQITTNALSVIKLQAV